MATSVLAHSSEETTPNIYSTSTNNTTANKTDQLITILRICSEAFNKIMKIQKVKKERTEVYQS